MTQPAIFKHLQTVADATRCRMLRILARQELTVSELCAVLQLPQSTVSRHLKALQDDGWVTSRRDGTRRFYGFAAELDADARGLWSVVEAQVSAMSVVRQDDLRVAAVLAERRKKSRDFFSSAAESWDHLRGELFGGSFHLQALPALLDEGWVVGDLGCGTGVVSETLAPWVRRVVAVDGSAEMLETAARRLQGLANVDLRPGELETLPLVDGELDAALLILVLPYVSEPARVLAEAARVLRPGGRLLVVDMLPHDREELRQQMGHLWLGFSEAQMDRLLAHAGFVRMRFHALPPDPDARGPQLFAAAAARPPARAAAGMPPLRSNEARPRLPEGPAGNPARSPSRKRSHS